MTETIRLEASKREHHGTSHAKRLRKTGAIPAIIYGKNQNSIPISLPSDALNKVMNKRSFHIKLIDLTIGKKNTKVILKNYQLHPGTGKLLHLDFQITSKDEKVTMSIPFHFSGIDNCPGVKTQSGIVSHLINEVEIQCLPADIPKKLDIDASQLQLNDVVHLADVKLPKSVTFNQALTEDYNPALLSIHLPKGVKADETSDQEDTAEETDDKSDS